MLGRGVMGAGGEARDALIRGSPVLGKRQNVAAGHDDTMRTGTQFEELLHQQIDGRFGGTVGSSDHATHGRGARVSPPLCMMRMSR